MISVDKFLSFLITEFLDPLLIHSYGFKPSYSTHIDNYCNFTYDLNIGGTTGQCIWWHEEPLNQKDLDAVRYIGALHPEKIGGRYTAEFPIAPGPTTQLPCYAFIYYCNFHIFANSEISQFKKQYLKEWNTNDWYFFYHGFAALDWFRDWKYIDYTNKTAKFDKVFICLNHLISKNRSYRITLLSHLYQKKLQNFGHISAPLLTKDNIKNELYDPYSRLSLNSKKHILNNLINNAYPLTLDTCEYNKASADIINDGYMQTALWNIVTETVFYDQALHLTEKIFKPIVTKRPFILVSSPGNLAYLKSYGFRTFNKWIDESYDDEHDSDIRIGLIVKQIEKLCNLSQSQLSAMYIEMQEILEYNHNHFYNAFKNTIVDELVNNFEGCLKKYNHGLSDRWRLDSSRINFERLKNILKN